MADRKISDLTALTTPASGDYLPIVDISEASAANKNKRITIEELLRGAPDGTAGAPGFAFESDPNTGIYSPGADALGLVTAGTERARIDSSGRLLVGTSSSRASFDTNLEIEATGFRAGVAATRNSNDANPAFIYLCKTRATSVGGNTLVANGDSLGQIQFLGADGTAPRLAASILAQVDGTPGANDMPGRLVFSTTADGASSPTERMRITSDGQMLIGTTVSTTVSGSGAPVAARIGNSLIVSGKGTISSPYTSSIQIDITWSNWGSNNVAGLVDFMCSLREYASTGGVAFGKIFATNTGNAATFSTFNTTDVTASQCAVTAASGGNYTLRITIDPSNSTDNYDYHLTIPSAGGTGQQVASVTVSLV